MPSATDIQRTARRAGVLYLVLSIVADVQLLLSPPRFVISGDAGRRPVHCRPEQL